jgi:cyclohexa-1,5-dienecarbonyl-CoA hydratase
VSAAGGAVRLERSGRTATLVVDRPPLNILDLALLAALEERIGELEGVADLQLVFVRGAGDRAFSAGVSVHDHTPDQLDRMLLGFHGALRRLRALDAVTVALVDGHCLGGGFELALACDLRFATERSKFGLPEIQLGCFPPVAAALLPRRIGPGRALELIATGRSFDAAQARELGLVDEVVPADGLAARAEAFAGAITALSAAATRLAKRAVRAGLARPFDAALGEAERLYLDELAKSADMVEGIDAFLAKRAPVWRHR